MVTACGNVRGEENPSHCSVTQWFSGNFLHLFHGCMATTLLTVVFLILLSVASVWGESIESGCVRSLPFTEDALFLSGLLGSIEGNPCRTQLFWGCGNNAGLNIKRGDAAMLLKKVAVVIPLGMEANPALVYRLLRSLRGNLRDASICYGLFFVIHQRDRVWNHPSAYQELLQFIESSLLSSYYLSPNGGQDLPLRHQARLSAYVYQSKERRDFVGASTFGSRRANALGFDFFYTVREDALFISPNWATGLSAYLLNGTSAIVGADHSLDTILMRAKPAVSGAAAHIVMDMVSWQLMEWWDEHRYPPIFTNQGIETFMSSVHRNLGGGTIVAKNVYVERVREVDWQISKEGEGGIADTNSQDRTEEQKSPELSEADRRRTMELYRSKIEEKLREGTY